jgi:hypothetical protein
MEAQLLALAADFSFSLCIQTGFGAHPASLQVGTGVAFSRGKTQLRKDTGHSLSSSAEVKNVPPCQDSFTYLLWMT